MVSALVLALCAVSCGGDEASTSRDQPRPPAAEPASNRVDTVRVTLDEYVIGMPRVLPAGTHVLSLESVGFEEHNLLFYVKSTDSLVWETGSRLSPYETRVVTVDLPPGTYSVVCDFSGHEGRGMFTELRVEAAPTGPG